MRTIYHQPQGHIHPMRGDLLQTNVGTRRERTWIVLSVHSLPARWCPEIGMVAQRTRIWAERWWEVEPAVRMGLYLSAERRPLGQQVWDFYRFPAKRKRTFEQLMRRSVA
jgi:hypothetical protein